MNALTLLHAPLFWTGLAMAAVPIVIHLLFRRRFRRIEWAPMKYLKLSIQRNRQRLRLEQLLLLLMRVAAVLLLFTAVARPVIHARGLGGWLGGSSRTSQLLILDDSLSMGYRDGGRSAFQRAQELALQFLDTLSASDRLTAVRASAPGEPLVTEVELTDRELIGNLIRQSEPADTSVSWPQTLAALQAALDSGTYPIKEVTLVTDLRRAGWEDKLTDLGLRWAAEGVRLRIFDVGSSRTDNVAVLGLEQMDRAALVGAPTRFEAVVRNGTDRAIEGLEAVFAVDDKPSAVRLQPIAPGATARLPLSATFQAVGTHHVAFRLAGDDLAADDRQFAVVEVRDHLDFVLVDGDPSSEPLAGEADFLALALSVGVGEAEAWRVEVQTDADWALAPLAKPDVLVLANVATLTPERARELEQLVEQGTGLMIFLGDQVDLDNYNQLLYRGGRGILPAELTALHEDEVSGLLLEDVTPSPLSALGQLRPAELEKVHVRKHFRVDLPDPAGNSRVLARWNDAAGSPAAVGKEVGRGRVLLWTITADRGWSDWPMEPSGVYAMRESAAAIARAHGGEHSLTAGQTLRRELAEGVNVASPVVATPASDKPQALHWETGHVDDSLRESESNPRSELATHQPPTALSYDKTDAAGLYKLSWTETPGGPKQDLYAVNPDGRESALDRIPPDELRTLFGSLNPEVIAATNATDAPLALRGREVWRSLAAGLLGLLLVESCFAAWVGRTR